MEYLSFYAIFGLCLPIVIYTLLPRQQSFRGIPVIEPSAELPYSTSARKIIFQGLRKFTSAFQVKTHSGYKIFLPIRFLEEIKHLTFTEFARREFFTDYNTFRSIKISSSDPVFRNVVLHNLTQALPQLTPTLLDEMSKSAAEVFPDTKEWKELQLMQILPRLVSRLSCRIFLGEEMCNNEEWLDISTRYAMGIFMTAEELRFWPAPLRPLANWLLPSTRRLRKDLQRATVIIEQLLERRKSAEKGSSSESTAIDWFESSGRGKAFDHALAQISLATSAVHTTSQLLGSVIFEICAQPEYIQELREEAEASLAATNGWSGDTFSKLVLMDSVIKETQRLHPVAITPINRSSTKPLTLSDGTLIPAGAPISISSASMTDPSVYPRPDEFDGKRFLRLRESSRAGERNKAQFTTPSPEHLGFGYGSHACPGRFFAANEIKVALVHLIREYDWCLCPGKGKPATIGMFEALFPDPSGTVMYRRRAAAE